MGDRTEVEGDDLDKLIYLTQVVFVPESTPIIIIFTIFRCWRRLSVCTHQHLGLGGSHHQLE